jgi:hypothetical protein
LFEVIHIYHDFFQGEIRDLLHEGLLLESYEKKNKKEWPLGRDGMTYARDFSSSAAFAMRQTPLDPNRSSSERL